MGSRKSPLIKEEVYDNWKEIKGKCEYNMWDISLDVPICAHPYCPVTGVISMIFLYLSRNMLKPIYCPVRASQVHGFKSKKEYVQWIFRTIPPPNFPI